jgi:hypothetical protein
MNPRRREPDNAMLATQHSTEALGERIERAYLRRRQSWTRVSHASSVWDAAAGCLLNAHRDDPSLPIDPELFVAAQPTSMRTSDPWQALTHSGSIWRYRRLVQRIIRSLRKELRGELRRAKQTLRQGKSLENVLSDDNPCFSPLARYILAQRENRPDLAEVFLSEAQDQHRACPLYRTAAQTLTPRGTYPVFEIVPGFELTRRAAESTPSFSMN